MANEADLAQPYIDAVIAAGRARAEYETLNRRLRPIVLELDGERFGLCHHCESPIRPGHLFCPVDPVTPEHSCSVEWEHERRRKEEMGL